MNPCRCCGMDITDHRERRKLASAPSAPVLSTLTRLLNRYYREFDVDLLHRGCICKGCFRCIQRLTRLEADTRKLQEEIRSRMSSVVRALSLGSMAEKLRRAIGVKVKLHQILQLESD